MSAGQEWLVTSGYSSHHRFPWSFPILLKFGRISRTSVYSSYWRFSKSMQRAQMSNTFDHCARGLAHLNSNAPTWNACFPNDLQKWAHLSHTCMQSYVRKLNTNFWLARECHKRIQRRQRWLAPSPAFIRSPQRRGASSTYSSHWRIYPGRIWKWTLFTMEAASCVLLDTYFHDDACISSETDNMSWKSQPCLCNELQCLIF